MRCLTTLRFSCERRFKRRSEFTQVPPSNKMPREQMQGLLTRARSSAASALGGPSMGGTGHAGGLGAAPGAPPKVHCEIGELFDREAFAESRFRVARERDC